VRFVVYPFVFSLLVMTFRRSFSGTWCHKHRLHKQILAGLITATVGWIGIPWGIIFAPQVLFQLARGGIQPDDENVQLLNRLAKHRLDTGDPAGAIRCIETSLKLQDAAITRTRLRGLYQAHGMPAAAPPLKQALAVVVALFLASAIGNTVGVLDYVSEATISAVLSWAPLIAAAYVGGLLLVHLIEWTLAHIHPLPHTVGICIAIVSATFAISGIPQGRATCAYISLLLSGLPFASLGHMLVTSEVVLTRGGSWVIANMFQRGGAFAFIYVMLLLVCGSYYVAMGNYAAQGMLTWRRRLKECRPAAAQHTDLALSAGWLGIAVVGLVTAIALVLYPQQGTVDFFDALVHVQQANEFWEYDNLEQATEALEEAVRLEPDLIIAQTSLGWVYYAQDELDKAEAQFLALVRAQPELSSAYEGLGLVQIEQRNYQKAISAFETALQIDPDSSAAHEGLGRVYYDREKWDEAVAELEQALALDDTSPTARLSLGAALMGQGKFSEAVEQFRALVEQNPDWAVPYAFLAVAHYQTDDLEQMEQALQAAQERQEEDGFAHYAVGVVYVWRNEFSRAKDLYLKAADLLPDKGYIYLALADVYAVLGEYSAAMQTGDRALELGEDPAQIHVTRSGVYVEQENLDSALAELMQAQDLDPEAANVYSSLAFVYYNQGKVAQALAAAERAIEINPYRASAYSNLALAHLAQDDLGPATKAAQRAIQLSPKQDVAHYILGLCHIELGESDEARAEFEIFLDLYYDRAYVREYRAKAEAYLTELK
jgi:tetratricopeptide (TPR) repeat protein